MDPRVKINAAVAFLISRKVAEPTAAPPLWRLFWRLGLLLPPPHFLGFLTVAGLTGTPFGIGISLVFTPILYCLGLHPDGWMVAAGATVGAAFGISLSAFYRWSAWRLNLPEWSNFDPHFDTTEDSW